MKKQTPLTYAILSGLFLIFGANSTSAQTAPVGVLGLYQGDTIKFDEARIADLGCSMRRAGFIGAAQGDIDLEQPNQFLLLACRASVLENAATRQDLAALNASNSAIAVLEGNLTNFEAPESAGEISERQYILKISKYNNTDVDARGNDLAELNEVAGQREDTYITESIVSVNRATGMPTPDEIVVLYYDDPATGDRFRKQNGDLLSRIGAFNKAHLTDFIYYVGQALR